METYSFIIEAAESFENLTDDGRPGGNVFSLCIGTQLCVVLKDTEAQSEDHRVSLIQRIEMEGRILTGAVAQRLVV